MKLGLLGFPISHSLSPVLYQKFLGPKLESYQLFEISNKDNIPSLAEFAQKLDGLNITSPFKSHFTHQVLIDSPLVKALGFINTLAFMANGKVKATNTDLLAVVEILQKYLSLYPKLKILLLGDGAMAETTKLVAKSLQIELYQLSRKTHPNFSKLNLIPFQEANKQTIIINSCSRDFIFQGTLSGEEIFWDFNYSFLPHQKTLPSQVKAYYDGQEMLELQAKAAIRFWTEVSP